MPRAVPESKVHKYLDETAALKVYWKTSVTDEMLQREVERMATGTRMPTRLLELYAALGNDPFLIKECLARASLVDRLVHNFYAFDPTIHADARQRADELHSQLASGELAPMADYPNRRAVELVIGEDDGSPRKTIQEPMSPEAFRPPQGDVQFELVTGVSAGVEGSLGTDSAG